MAGLHTTGHDDGVPLILCGCGCGNDRDAALGERMDATGGQYIGLTRDNARVYIGDTVTGDGSGTALPPADGGFHMRIDGGPWVPVGDTTSALPDADTGVYTVSGEQYVGLTRDNPALQSILSTAFDAPIGDTTAESHTPPPSPSLEARVRAIVDELRTDSDHHGTSVHAYWQGYAAEARAAVYLLERALSGTLTPDDLEHATLPAGEADAPAHPMTWPDANDVWQAKLERYICSLRNQLHEAGIDPVACPEVGFEPGSETKPSVRAERTLAGYEQLQARIAELEASRTRLTEALEAKGRDNARLHTDATTLRRDLGQATQENAQLDLKAKQQAREIERLTACNAVLKREMEATQRQSVLWQRMTEMAVREVGS